MTDPTDPVKSSQRLSKQELPRRFYKAAEVIPHEEGFAVALDGKVPKVPGGRRPLAVGDRALAEALAAEWAAQGEYIEPASMPLTRIVNSAIEHVGGHMEAVRAEIVKYAGSDMICYRAEEPASLVAAQEAAWSPLVTWARGALDARFILAAGVVHVAQQAEALAAVDRALQPLDALKLAAVHVITTLTGSAIIALAVLRGRLTAEEAWTVAHVDEDWQASHWGSDPAAIARRTGRWREMAAAGLIMKTGNA